MAIFQLDKSYIDDLLIAAKNKAIEADLAMHKALYDEIESYILANDCVVYSSIHESYVYTVFCTDALKFGNNLSNLLAKTYTFVELKTVIPYKAFNLVVDFKIVMKIIKYTKILYTVEKFKITKPEYELIDVYTKLYQLQNEKQWDNLLKREEQLFDALDLPDKEYKKTFEYRELLNLDVVYCGYIAAVTYGAHYSDKIQVISAYAEDTIRQIVGILKDTVVKTFEVSNTDYREKRTTIYKIIKRDSKIYNMPVIDVFNTAEFDLIGYTMVNGKKIAHPYVVVSKMLLDVCVYENHKISKTILSNVLKNVKPITLVYGQYADLNNAVKLDYGPTMFYPYKPFLQYKMTGKFREV